MLVSIVPLKWAMSPEHVWVVLESLATCVLAIAATAALVQLFFLKQAVDIAKQDILIRSGREAKALAARLCELYGTETIPYVTKEFEELRKKGPFIIFETKEVKVAYTSFADPSAAEAAAKALCENRVQFIHACNILNKHEALALYFCSGAADEEIAFPVISAMFCDKVHTFLPALIRMRRGAKGIASGPFENTVKLYESWAARRKHLEVDAHVQGVSSKRNPPLGTIL